MEQPGPSADDYLEKDMFREAGICLEYKSYDYEPYPQIMGESLKGGDRAGSDSQLRAGDENIDTKQIPQYG